MPPSTSAHVSTTRRFTVFPQLPLEIRCLIWNAMCEPRTVELLYDEEEPEGFCSRVGNPKTLEICRESRNAVINSYPLCFGSIFFPARVRFNFALDTLFIDNEFEENLPHLFSTFKDAEISGLRYLALDEYFVIGYRIDEDKHAEGLRRALRTLKSLKEVLLVFDIESMAEGGRIGCEDEHRKIIYDEMPEELVFGHVPIAPLPTMEQFEKRGIMVWDGPCRPVYGWRRCPSWMEIHEMDLEIENGSDGSNFDVSPTPFSFWPGAIGYRGIPWPVPDSTDSDLADEDEEDPDDPESLD